MEVSLSQKVLTIIDMQVKFIKKGEHTLEIRGIRQLIDSFKKKKQDIAIVEYMSFGNTIPKIYNKIRKYPYHYVDKDSNDGSAEILRTIDSPVYVVCGIYADYCIAETVEGLAYSNKQVEVVTDCCGVYKDSYDYKFRHLKSVLSCNVAKNVKFTTKEAYLV